MLYLYEEQVRDLKRMAAHMDEPMSKLIRHAVDDFLKKHKRKKVAEKT